MFLFYVLLPDLVLRVLGIFFMKTGNSFEWKKLILLLAMPLLSSWWWIYTMVQYDKLTTHCYNPYPTFSLMVYWAALVVIIPTAFIVICVLSFLVLFSPCICWLLCRVWGDARERAAIKEMVIKSLPKVSYDPKKYHHQRQCCICMQDFEIDERITPLSCDIRHFFHSDCIEHWMKEKNQCPLCKKEINVQSLVNFQAQIDALAAEEEARKSEVEPELLRR